MRTESITNSSTEIFGVYDLDHLEEPLTGALARSVNREVQQGPNKHYLAAFEQKDLSNSFRKYCVEEFVQRNLRRAGFITVGDMLALDVTEFQAFIGGENQTVQARSLSLYRALQLEKSKIVRHHSRGRENRSSPPLLDGSTNAPPESISNDVALSAVESNRRGSQLGLETDDGVLSERENPKNTAVDADQVLNNPKIDKKQTSLELPPIHLGQVFRRDRFQTERTSGYQELAYTEEGLRRHVLIAGSTGSGKTVAARYIVEQAAISGVPSIVIDAQGDISSLVLDVSAPNVVTFYEEISSLQKPETRTEEEDLNAKIRKHLEALSKHPGPISGLYAKRSLPRIFTPGRPDVGLQISLPPYLDILAAYSDESSDELQRHELDELLSDEVENLVRTILPRLKPDKHKGYVELLVRLFRYANEQRISLDGRLGIKKLHELVQRAQELAPELFRNYLSDKDRNELSKAIYGLQFYQEQKWLEGQSLDIAALCIPGADNRTPINIINVQELHSHDDRKRVLRQVIAAVYKYGVKNPRHSGPPSLLLYIDEIGTGYGERSVGKPEQTATYQVYRVLNRLVRQARKYGIAVMLASQSYTDFNPDLRRQLGTKIIGKVDDRTEQFRVAQSIGEDLAVGGRDPRQFVQNELPRLGPPRLLYVGVRGDADTYEQFKCCTLDVIFDKRAVRRWREAYQQKTQDILENADNLFQTDRWAEALQKLDQIANETHFVTALCSRVTALRGRCLVRLDRRSEAERLFEEGDSETAAAGWIDLGRDLARWYREFGLSEKYVRTLKRTAELAAVLYPNISEEIQLELSKYNLFEAGDPCAAEDNLKAISESQDQKITLFARTWRKAAALFRSWASAWPFVSSTWAGGEVSLVEPVTGQLAVAITVLPRNEDSAKEPIAYRSELEKNPEILRISRILDKDTKQRPSFFSLNELNSFQSDYQTRLGRAHEFRDTGCIREAITELEQLFKLPQIVAPDPQEIKRYDEDPEVRRVRVADWLNGLDWRAFEFEVAILFAQMGYNAWATGRTGDGGVDVRALRGNEKVVIQCKHWKRQNVGVDVVKAIHATKEGEGASCAVIVTSSNLEPVAHHWAERFGVEVIQGSRLVDLFMQYCDPVKPQDPVNSLWQENPTSAPRHEPAMNPALDRLNATGIATRLPGDQPELAERRPEIRQARFQIPCSNQSERSGKRFILKALEDLGKQYSDLRCSKCDSEATLDITNKDGVHSVCKKTSSHRERVDRTTLQRLADHLGVQCRLCGSTNLESKEGAANIYLKCTNCATNNSWEGISNRIGRP